MKKKYRIRNWSAYNNSLVSRGNLEVWVEPGFEKRWINQERSGERGAPEQYSDEAILWALTLRELLRLPLRQTEGLVKSLLKWMGHEELPVPDYSTLSYRQKFLKVPKVLRRVGEKIVAVVDSTGLKVYGEGEWKVRQHGVSKRRTWRKLHLMVDALSQEIVMSELTLNDKHDGEVAPDLIKKAIAVGVELKSLGGDGAYDQKSVYESCLEHGIEPIIPPRENAKIWRHGNSKQPAHPRDEALRSIRKHGRKKWKRESGYHRRSLAEVAMFRYKTVFGNTLKNRKFENQQTEAAIRCYALNKMTRLGMPDTVEITA